MNKKVFTIIIGFIAGLAISGVLSDAITFANNSINRTRGAWYSSSAERSVARGNLDTALKYYDKAFKYLKPSYKSAYAKARNNQALVLLEVSENNNDVAGMRRAIEYFAEALNIYTDLSENRLKNETQLNLDHAINILAEHS
jgi:tetratricopeptide (TPR) repeat protein